MQVINHTKHSISLHHGTITFVRILQLGMKAMLVPQRTITSVTWIRICLGSPVRLAVERENQFDVLKMGVKCGVNMKAPIHCYTLNKQ